MNEENFPPHETEAHKVAIEMNNPCADDCPQYRAKWERGIECLKRWQASKGEINMRNSWGDFPGSHGFSVVYYVLQLGGKIIRKNSDWGMEIRRMPPCRQRHRHPRAEHSYPRLWP